MSEDSAASAQEVRAVLAKWTANDWRHAFALTAQLEGSIRRVCEVPDHNPLANNAGALAMPVLKRLGQLELDELLQALAPLLVTLEQRLVQTGTYAADLPAALDALRGQEDVGPGLANLAGCRLGRHPSLADLAEAAPEPAPDLSQAIDALDEAQPIAVAAARQLLADAEAGRPASRTDLVRVRQWNDALSRATADDGVSSLDGLRALRAERAQAASTAEGEAALTRTLQQVAAVSLTDGARPVLASALDEAAAAAADAGALQPERAEAFRALHRLLSQPSWEVSEADVEDVEEAFGRKVARVAVAERTDERRT